ncbi:hypothetical protein SNEBB_000917 [Seison nebaliae]|nr:hypothetical protein SNEBB_000917 [Seison nebaliae]
MKIVSRNLLNQTSKRLACSSPSARKNEKNLQICNMNRNVIDLQYAVRGPIPNRAIELELELERGVKKSFNSVLRCNIGDCHALGQMPLTYVRQTLSSILNKDLLETDFVPSDIKEKAKRILGSCKGESVGSYTESKGITSVREDVVNYINKRDGTDRKCDINNIYITAGASEGIRSILELFITQNNLKKSGILIPIPQYPLYSATITEFGLSDMGYYLNEEQGWSLTLEELEETYKRRRDDVEVEPRAIVIINPGNPTGQVLTEENIKLVIKFAYEKNLVILADEVYQDNIFAKEAAFHSFRKVLLGMGKPYSDLELVSFHSVSKGYFGECGLRGGYMEVMNFDPAVEAMLYKMLTAKLCPSSIGQAAVSCAIAPPSSDGPSYNKWLEEKEKILSELKLKGELITELFNSIPGISCNPVCGAMYCFPKLELPSKLIEKAKSLEMTPDSYYCKELLERTGICVVPGSGFLQKPGTYHFRITILPPVEQIKEALATFKKFHIEFLNELTNRIDYKTVFFISHKNEDQSNRSKIRKVALTPIMIGSLLIGFLVISGIIVGLALAISNVNNSDESNFTTVLTSIISSTFTSTTTKTTIDTTTIQTSRSTSNVSNLQPRIFTFISPGSEPCENYYNVSMSMGCPFRKFRTIDGSCNNKIHMWKGKSFTPMKRLQSPIDLTNRTLPTPREITLKVHGTSALPDSDFLNHLHMSFGQFLSHDMTLADSAFDGFSSMPGRCPCNGNSTLCQNFPIEENDEFFENFETKTCQTISHVNSISLTNDSCADMKYPDRNAINDPTSFIDLSHIYGSVQNDADVLRLNFAGKLTGNRGNKNKTNNRKTFPRKGRDCIMNRDNEDCFLTGDKRTGENTGLAILHVIFFRFHNIISEKLRKYHDDWTDDELFEESRKIASGVFQHISYNEYVRTTVGDELSETFHLLSLENEMNAAAFRFGHTQIRESMSILYNNGTKKQEAVPMSQTLFTTKQLKNESYGLNGFLYGLLYDAAGKGNEIFPISMHSQLFADFDENSRIKFAHDLAGIDIQRGRAAGLDGYINYKHLCDQYIDQIKTGTYGKKEEVECPTKTWEDLKELDIIEPDVIVKLQSVYENIEDIDLFVGAMSEKHSKGGTTGPTFGCLIAENFYRTKFGDRYYYENGGDDQQFTKAQLRQIRKSSLAYVLCMTIDGIEKIQPHALELPTNDGNEMVSCDSIPKINYKKWE